jgi:sugar phosphate isomerase/epimerase
MLLTLSVAALRDQLDLDGSDGPISPFDVPKLAIDEFDLNGLHLPTWLFRGWGAKQVDRFRDRADKAGCPCLVLSEDEPHPMCDEADDTVRDTVERMERVLRVAHRLGCSSVAMTIAERTSEDARDFARENLRDLVKRAERFELNLLLKPHAGITGEPESLTTLIRDVGGFRIGTCPSFVAAGATGDPAGYLKAVTPYASAVVAQTGKIGPKGEHPAYDLHACVEALRAVGYDGSVAIEPTDGDVMEQIGLARAALAELLETENA